MKKKIKRKTRNKSKLSENDVIKIWKYISYGYLLKDIAKLFNVDPTTISDIKRGKSWRYIKNNIGVKLCQA